MVFFSFFGFDYWKKCILINGFCISAKKCKISFLKIRKYEGLWKFCSDGQERMEWFRKSFSKILYKYNRLSIFNVELFLVSQVKTMFKQHVREKFLEITKVFGLLRKKKNISFYQGSRYTRDLVASWSPIVHKSLCVSLCIACFSFGPIHIQYSTLEKN